LAAATYEEHVLTLSRGDRLYFCTDGIIEADNNANEEFGIARLLDALTAGRDASLAGTVSSLMDQVQKWTAPGYPEDDASIIAIERSPDSR
jgi:serine phosphatase RsbU (regulator of sigma subunit)